MTRSVMVFGALMLGVVALNGCGSNEAALDPRLEPLSPVARDAFGAVITEAEPMLIRSAQGMKLSMMGQNLDREADLDAPIAITEIDADGEMHMNIDPTPAMVVDVGTDVTVELWSDNSEMVWNVSRGYSQLIGQAAQELDDSAVYQALAGVYQDAGEFRVDLAKVDDTGLGADPVVEQFTGTSWDQMFASFAEHFDAATPVDGDDKTRSLTLTYRELYGSEAASKLLESMFGSMTPFDDSATSAFLDDVLNAPVVATITLDDEGRVQRTEFVIDLADAMKSLIVDAAAASDENPTQAEVDAVTDGIEMEVHGIVSVTYDESIEVEMPTGVTDDRTDAYIDLIEVLTDDAAGTGESVPATTLAS